MEIVTLGLDLAKSVFQAHGIDRLGKTVLVKRLDRKQMMPFFSSLPPCLIGIEACATAHHRCAQVPTEAYSTVVKTGSVMTSVASFAARAAVLPACAVHYRLCVISSAH